jgi:hypothetical protein
MLPSDSIPLKSQSLGEAASGGLINGLLAGAAMLAVLALGGLLTGEAPADLLARFSTGQTTTPAAGALLHLAVSGVYGAVFGLLIYLLPAAWLRRLPGWFSGLLYAAGLLLVAESVLLPGLESPLSELPL